MIGFVRGRVAGMDGENLVLETGGIGYNIKITPNIAAFLPREGEEIKLYTYLSVREDAMNLYGFLTKDDLDFFRLLIGVNGIGPKGAQVVLSGMSADDLRFAILSGDVKTITKAPGIGAKTAQRIILDLKDKLDLEDAFRLRTDHMAGADQTGMTDARQEAVEALTALGYTSTDAMKAVNKVTEEDAADVEAILKSALKKMI